MGLGWTRPKTNFEADVADDKAKDPTNGGSAFDGRTLTSLLSAPSTPSTPTPMPATVNTTNYDPNQQKIMDQISQRISGDMGAGEASRLAAGKIRESSVGANKEAAANRTMRGVSGTPSIRARSRRRRSGPSPDRHPTSRPMPSNRRTACWGPPEA